MASLRFRSGRRPGPGRPGCPLSGCFDEGFVLLGRDDLDLGPHRRVGLAGEGRRARRRRCPPRRRGRRPGWSCPGTASRLPASSGTFQVWTTSVETQVELDRGVDRDDQLVIGEGFVGVVVAPQPLLAGRLDPQRLGLRRLRGRPAPVAGVSRALSVKTMPRTKQDRGEER